MDVGAARAELAGALETDAAAGRTGSGRRAALGVLIERGIEVFRIPPKAGLGLDDVLRIGAEAESTRDRRDFAVLLVHAIGMDGLLPARGESERRLHSFLERALLNPLRRAGYPFDGTPYDKRRSLSLLHATIDEHLRPLEPTIPRWIHGVGPSDER